jgi:hypothetical protein
MAIGLIIQAIDVMYVTKSVAYLDNGSKGSTHTRSRA